MTPRLFCLGALALGLSGCGTATSDPIAQLPGAQFITFRCVSADGTTGMPLDGCGCVETLPDGTRRRMGRVECTCRDVLDRKIAAVEVDPASCTGAGSARTCEPLRGDDGDWIPYGLDDDRRYACAPRRDGQVRAYVGSGEQGNVAVLDVTVDPGDSAAGAKQVLDVDRTIPGITSIYVDDLVSDIQTHPDGTFVFTVNSSSGTLSVIREDGALREDFKLDLGEGPLLRAEVWPPPTRAGLATDGPRLAFVTAPRNGVVLQLDLAALDVAETQGAEGVVQRVLSMPAGATPGHVALHPAGTHLFVSHVRFDRVTAFDVATGEAETFALRDVSDCQDPYLVRVESLDDDPTCADGLDNDLDGLSDGDDPDCTAGSGSEARVLGCPKTSECADGTDNDLDGLIDGEDPECDPAACSGDACAAFLDWEGAVPACADGVDNDGDGRIDRADPGCRDEGDGDETDDLERSTCANGLDDDGDGDIDGADGDCAASAGLVLPEEGVPGRCANGEDDDADGLIDAEDPGCTDANAGDRHNFERVPRCADGIDNDADGRTDFGEDPDCFGAVDDNEGGSAVDIGPSAMLAAQVPADGVLRSFLYLVDGDGNLQRVDLDSPTRAARRITVGSDVQAMALRQRGYESTLLAVGDDTFLRALQITAPTPVLTPQRLPVFARLEVAPDGRPVAAGFYAVVDGVAWPVDGLEEFVGQVYDEDDLFRIDRAEASVAFELPVEGDERTPVDLIDPAVPALDYGALDPMVFLTADRNTLLHAEDNLRRTARSRNNRVVTTPQLFINNAPVTADFATTASFCRQPSACVEPSGEEEPGCVPVGFTADGTRATAESIAERTRCTISPYAGITVLEEDPDDFRSERMTLAFEGTIAGSESRTGQFGGREGDDAWTLLDYDADFCRLGIEADDVVLVDVFVPLDAVAADTPECQALADVGSVDPTRVRERLRYRVAGVGQHKLALEREPRARYRMRPRTVGGSLPTLFPAPPAPLFECAAQFIKYKVRVANDQWALSGQSSGFRHPWVAQDGQCVRDQRRVDAARNSRARLGAPFENEWIGFTLGNPRLADCAPGDTSDACLPPYSIDTRFEFNVEAGFGTSRLGDLILPGEIRWLPADDRLYVVDTALQAVVEVGGLDVYHAPFVKLRTIR